MDCGAVGTGNAARIDCEGVQKNQILFCRAERRSSRVGKKRNISIGGNRIRKEKRCYMHLFLIKVFFLSLFVFLYFLPFSFFISLDWRSGSPFCSLVAGFVLIVLQACPELFVTKHVREGAEEMVKYLEPLPMDE
jgi:hypothetical protein